MQSGDRPKASLFCFIGSAICAWAVNSRDSHPYYTSGKDTILSTGESAEDTSPEARGSNGREESAAHLGAGPPSAAQLTHGTQKV